MKNERGFLLLEVIVIIFAITVITHTFIAFHSIASEKMREKKEELEFLMVAYEGAQLCAQHVRCVGKTEKDKTMYQWFVQDCSVVVKREDGRRKRIACDEKKG